MGIIDKTLSRFGYINSKQLSDEINERLKIELDAIKFHSNEKPPVWAGETADAYRYRVPDPYVFATQADMYRISPILGTAVEVLSNDVGTSTFNVKRMVGENEKDIPNHEFEILLRNPNPLDSGLEFMQYTVANYKLNGNAIWWINRSNEHSKPDELWPIPFSMIQPVPDKYLYISHYNYFPGEGKPPIPFQPWEIVQFKTYNPDNRFIGLSPIESIAQTLRGDLAMRKTNTINYSEYGGAPQSILAFKDFVPNQAWNNIKEEKREAAKRNEMMMLRGVGDGVTWLQRALSNKDMDFVAGLKQNMVDVFNRMCPGLLAMLSESATEANALAARATYSEKTLWPMMEAIAQKITVDLLPAYGRKLKGEFDDPRVVDRKLELEEQYAFERTHTIEETRKKYYQDDPLGDGRDKMIAAELRRDNQQQRQSSAGGDVNNNGQSEAPSTDVPNDQIDVTAKMQSIDELNKWMRKALKRVGRPTPFVTDILDANTIDLINNNLADCKNDLAVKALFEKARATVIPPMDANAILEGIRLGVQALADKHG